MSYEKLPERELMSASQAVASDFRQSLQIVHQLEWSGNRTSQCSNDSEHRNQYTK